MLKSPFCSSHRRNHIRLRRKPALLVFPGTVLGQALTAALPSLFHRFYAKFAHLVDEVRLRLFVRAGGEDALEQLLIPILPLRVAAIVAAKFQRAIQEPLQRRGVFAVKLQRSSVHEFRIGKVAPAQQLLCKGEAALQVEVCTAIGIHGEKFFVKGKALVFGKTVDVVDVPAQEIIPSRKVVFYDEGEIFFCGHKTAAPQQDGFCLAQNGKNIFCICFGNFGQACFERGKIGRVLRRGE